MFIKDVNQIINLYKVINSLVQDIENVISAVKLGIMHPIVNLWQNFKNNYKF